jgi:hypothetical protein
MKAWRAFPKGAWASVGNVLTGFGQGEGSYGLAYAVDTSMQALVNGRVSARIRLAGTGAMEGAGVMCRANDLRSFVGLYVVSVPSKPKHFSLRLAAFKHGKIVSLVGLKEPVLIPSGELHATLRFFSGDVTGEIKIGSDVFRLNYLIPQIPFPGLCGIVRFYGASVVAHQVEIENLAMTPILPDVEPSEIVTSERTLPYQVFLSYATEDTNIVSQVVQAFKARGLSYWVDYEQIEFGDRIVEKIEEGLQGSRYIVACLSKRQAESGWCRAEYGTLLYREFSGETARRVIPLSLDGTEKGASVPFLLSDKLRADFSNKDNFEKFLKFLERPASA